MTRLVRFLCLSAACAGVLAAPALAQTGDPLAGLSDKVAGLLDINTPNARIMLVEEDHGVGNSWFLALNEEYADGWRLTQVGSNAVTLTKDGQTRQIPVTMTARAQTARTPQLALNVPSPQQTVPLSSAAAAPPGRSAAAGRGAASAGRGNAAGRGGATASTPAPNGNFGLFVGGEGRLAAPAPVPAAPRAPVIIQGPDGQPIQLPPNTVFVPGASVPLPPGVDPSALANGQTVVIQQGDAGQRQVIVRGVRAAPAGE